MLAMYVASSGREDSPSSPSGTVFKAHEEADRMTIISQDNDSGTTIT